MDHLRLTAHGTAYDNVRWHGWGDDWSFSLSRSLRRVGSNDIVVIHLNDYAAARLAMRAAHKARRVVVFHGLGIGSYDEHLGAADALVVLREDARLALVAAGAPSERVRHQQPSVDRRLFRPESKAGTGVVGFVGRLEDSKGIYDIPPALRRLDRPPAVECIGFVSPTERQRLEAAFDGLHVELLGEQPPAAVATRLSHWQALLLPSYTEGFGIVAAEALATNTPVAAVDGVLPAELARRRGVLTAARDQYHRAVDAAIHFTGRCEADWILDHSDAAQVWDELYASLPQWSAGPKLSPRPWFGRHRRAMIRLTRR